MSSTATTVTWILTTVAVAGGTYVAVQQMKSDPEPEIIVEAPVSAKPTIVIKKPPVAEIVRIDSGMATIAGEGNPGENIIIVDQGQEVARAKVEADGTFALVFEYETPSEGSILELTEQNADGEILKADKSIAVLPKYSDKTVTASLDDNVIKVEVDNRAQMKFAGIVYGDSEEATISGYSTPNTTISVLLDGEKLADISTGETGQWSQTIDQLVDGKHQLKLVGSDEQLLEVEIERAPVVNTARIQKGDTLWRIAEKSLGDGYKYIDIYNMNAEKITDPNLIYPDQEIIIKPR